MISSQLVLDDVIKSLIGVGTLHLTLRDKDQGPGLGTCCLLPRPNCIVYKNFNFNLIGSQKSLLHAFCKCTILINYKYHCYLHVPC